MKIAVIGAGRVGTALAVLLQRAGHEAVAVCGRDASRKRAESYLPGAPFFEPERAAEAASVADVVIFATPDDLIEPTVRAVAEGGGLAPGKWAVHVSGASGLEALEPARAKGARLCAVHPLQTAPDVDSALERLPGSPVAVTAEDEEGAAFGEQLARSWSGVPFRLDAAARPLYHAAAVFASNYLVAVTALAVQALEAAGVPDALSVIEPLQRATLENVHDLGPDAALTGPAVRGDAETVASNLQALSESAPQAVPAYLALARAALDLAAGSGRLAPERVAEVEAVLARWDR